MLPPCKNLQSVNCDLTQTMYYVDIFLREIHNVWTNTNFTFSKFFKKTKGFYQINGGKEDIQISRIV